MVLELESVPESEQVPESEPVPESKLAPESVYDQDSRTVLWTVICATKESQVSGRYAFELELYSPVNTWQLLVQRFPCHSELDPDFLKDGHCAKLALADALRFMADDKVRA